jgi:hypothetical protein
MTEPIDWLRTTQGLDALEPKEINAIRDFTLLWGLFEGRAMDTEGSQPKLVAAVDRMPVPQPLLPEMAEAIAFWRNRYWELGEPTPAFTALNFRLNPYRALVIEVLSGARDGDADVLKALLLIILRLRNNLFHGVKWQYLLYDQFENFTHANAVLMPAIELAVPPPLPPYMRSRRFQVAHLLSPQRTSAILQDKRIGCLVADQPADYVVQGLASLAISKQLGAVVSQQRLG